MSFSDWKNNQKKQEPGTVKSPVSGGSEQVDNGIVKPNFSDWRREKTKATRQEAVSSWVEKYNNTMKAIADHGAQLNGGYTTDVSGGYSGAVDELLLGYDLIRDSAAEFGLADGEKYYQQLLDLQGNIRSANDWYAKFTPTEEQAAAGYTAEKLYAKWSKDNDYRQKYQGKSYSELMSIIGTMDDGDEKSWLTAYATSVMTAADYDAEITNTDAEIKRLQEMYDRIYNSDDVNAYALESWYTEYSTSSKENRPDPEMDAKNLKLYNELRGEFESFQAIKDRIDQLKASKWQLENDKKYKLLAGNTDFEEKSKAAHTEQTSNYLDYVLKNDKWRYDIVNGLIASTASKAAEDGNPIMMGVWNELEANVSYMLDDEKKIFNYLYNTQGTDSATAYLESIQSSLSERADKYTIDEWKKLAKKHPVSGSAVSVVTNLYGGLGYIDAAVQKVVNSAKETITGEYAGPVNYNSAAMMPSKITTAIRGQVSQDLVDKYGVIEMKEEEHPILSRILNGKSWADVYQLGMSMVDSAAVAGLSTVMGPNATLLLSGSAATQTMLDAVANGATDEQALTMGAVAGAFEYIFEKYELEHLLGADTNVVKAIFNQALTEAIGEGATSIANFAADTFIMAENSDLQRKVKEYMEANPNMTEAEAMKKALLDKCIEIGWDTAGGLVSGGFMGGGSSLIKNVSGKLQQSQGGVQTPQQSPAPEGMDPTTVPGITVGGGEQITNNVADASPGTKNNGVKGTDSSTPLGMTGTNTAAAPQQVKTAQTAVPQNDTYEAIIQDWEDNERAYMQGAITQEEHASAKAQIEQRLEAWRQAENLRQNNTPVQSAQEQVENAGELRSMAERLFAEGGITEEEFDAMMDLAEHYEEENYGGVREQPVQDLPATVQADTYDGGIEHVNNGTQHTAQSTAYQGDRVPDGSSQRNDGAGTGKQAGGMASLTEGGRSSWADQRTTAARRKVNGTNLPQVSSRSFGLKRGTDENTLRIVPQTNWDSEEQRTAVRIKEETGLQVSYVLGDIWVQGSKGKVVKVRGVIIGDQIIIRADDKKATIDQIADHEIYHYKSRTTPGMTWNIEHYIRGKFTEEQWQKILQAYVKAYEGIIDVSEDGDVQMDEEAVRKLAEEIFADAYAGINNFGAGVFTEDVNQWMDDHSVGKQTAQENGTKEATGPPAVERYSADVDNMQIGQRIYPGMDESVRAKILSQKEIQVPAFDDTNPVTAIQIIELKKHYVTSARSILTELARQCGIFKSDYYNADVDLEQYRPETDPVHSDGDHHHADGAGICHGAGCFPDGEPGPCPEPGAPGRGCHPDSQVRLRKGR